MAEDRAPTFATLLRRLRFAAGLSQDVLADRAGLSAVSISALERGFRKTPHRNTVESLADALQLEPPHRERLQRAAVTAARPRDRRAAPGERAQRRESGDTIPIPLTSFHGREREVETLRATLQSRRLVTLRGVGGVGKTRLAIETALGTRDDFSDGSFFADLGSVVEPELVPARIASAVMLRERSSSRLLERLIFALRERRLLLVLDNCEHVADAVAAVAQRLLESCAQLHVLATSREPLRVPGERVHVVPPLGLPALQATSPSPEELRQSPAIRLFLDRAGDVAPELALDEDEKRRSLLAICRHLDGLPLAIELAAARTSAFDLATIEAQLNDRFGFLANGARTASPRHQTLRATLDWSYALLSEAERVAFRQLGIFNGGWTLGAARAVCAAGDAGAAPGVLNLLASLLEKSLVSLDETNGTVRYRMLETTRAFASQLLAQSAEREVTARRYLAHFVHCAERADETFGRLATDDWLMPLQPDIDNFRAALRFGLQTEGQSELAARLAGALQWFFFHLGLHAEGADYAEAALTALDERTAASVEPRLHLALALYYLSVRGLTRRLAVAERAVALYRPLDKRDKLALALEQLAEALMRAGRRDEADRAATEALSLARQCHNPQLLTWILRTKSFTVPAGDIEVRRTLLVEAVDLMTDLGDDNGRAMSLVWLGAAEVDAGAYETALEYTQQSLDVYRCLRLTREIVICLDNVAAFYITLGQTAQARDAAREAIALLKAGAEVGSGTTTSLQHLAAVAAKDGKVRCAARITGFCDARRRDLDQPRYPIAQHGYDKLLAQTGSIALQSRACSTDGGGGGIQ